MIFPSPEWFPKWPLLSKMAIIYQNGVIKKHQTIGVVIKKSYEFGLGWNLGCGGIRLRMKLGLGCNWGSIRKFTTVVPKFIFGAE